MPSPPQTGDAPKQRGRSKLKYDPNIRSRSESRSGSRLMGFKLKGRKALQRHVTVSGPLQGHDSKDYQLWAKSPNKEEPPYPLFGE
jgi:hypothetical protein